MADAESKQRLIKVVAEGEVVGPHLKVIGDGSIDFGNVFKGAKPTTQLRLSNEGDEKLDVSMVDSERLLTSERVSLGPGEEREVSLTLDSLGVARAAAMQWSVSLLSNTATYPYSLQTVKCSANIITLNCSLPSALPWEVFYSDTHEASIAFKRSDGQKISIAIDEQKPDTFLTLEKSSARNLNVKFNARDPSALKERHSFELLVRDELSGVLECRVVLEYRVIAAKAAGEFISPKKYHAKMRNEIAFRIKNAGDQKLKIFSVRRKSFEPGAKKETISAAIPLAQNVLEPSEGLDIRYPVGSTPYERLAKYKHFRERIEIISSDRSGKTIAIEQNFTAEPYYDRPKRVATACFFSFVAVVFLCMAKYCSDRGVAPTPRNAIAQLRGSNLNYSGLRSAYDGTDVVAGDALSFESFVNAFQLIATKRARDSIQTYEGNIGLVRDLSRLMNNRMTPTQANSLYALKDCQRIQKVSYPKKNANQFRSKLQTFLVAEIANRNAQSKHLLKSGGRTSDTDRLACTTLLPAAHAIENFAECLGLGSQSVNALKGETAELLQVCNATSYVEFQNIPPGSRIYLEGSEVARSDSHRYIIQRSRSYRYEVSHPLYYPSPGQFVNEGNGTKWISVSMKPREGRSVWRPTDDGQPEVASVTCIGNGINKLVDNGEALRPGLYTFVFRFTNGGEKSYERRIESLQPVTIEYECNMGDVVVNTIPAAAIYKLDRNGKWVLLGSSGYAAFREYYGKCKIRLVPITNIYAEEEKEIEINQVREQFDFSLEQKGL
jgi:hypothetical protein